MSGPKPRRRSRLSERVLAVWVTAATDSSSRSSARASREQPRSPPPQPRPQYSGSNDRKSSSTPRHRLNEAPPITSPVATSAMQSAPHRSPNDRRSRRLDLGPPPPDLPESGATSVSVNRRSSPTCRRPSTPATGSAPSRSTHRSEACLDSSDHNAVPEPADPDYGIHMPIIAVTNLLDADLITSRTTAFADLGRDMISTLLLDVRRSTLAELIWRPSPRYQVSREHVVAAPACPHLRRPRRPLRDGLPVTPGQRPTAPACSTPSGAVPAHTASSSSNNHTIHVQHPLQPHEAIMHHINISSRSAPTSRPSTKSITPDGVDDSVTMILQCQWAAFGSTGRALRRSADTTTVWNVRTNEMTAPLPTRAATTCLHWRAARRPRTTTTTTSPPHPQFSTIDVARVPTPPVPLSPATHRAEAPPRRRRSSRPSNVGAVSDPVPSIRSRS